MEGSWIERAPEAPLAVTAIPAPPAAEEIGRPLRVAVVLESLVVPRWIDKVVTAIRASAFLDVPIVAVGDAERRGSRRGESDRWNLLWKIYCAIDHGLQKTNKDALEQVDIASTLAGTDVMRTAGQLGDRDLRQLREADLDVLLHLRRGPIQSGLFGCAKQGVLSLRPGDVVWEPSSFFSEIYRADPVWTIALQIQTDEHDQAFTLQRSVSAIVGPSARRNRNVACWKAAEIVVRGLRRLRWHGPIPAAAAAQHDREDVPPRHEVSPSSARMVRLLARILMAGMRRQVRRVIFKGQWIIAIRKKEWRLLRERNGGPFRVMAPPKDRFYADPFLFERDGRQYVFFEDYRYDTRKAVISCAQVSEAGEIARPRIVLEKDHHLSYPYVFESDGEIYLLPETSANRTIEIYRSVVFPEQWKLEKIVLDGVDASDATIFRYRERFWLFAGIRVPGTPEWDELHLYMADTLLGRWEPHPLNPVVSDARVARPAGRPFWDGADLIRPGQDGSIHYGRAISLNRVEVLSETEYREVPIGRIAPDWLPGIDGTHHIDHNEEFEVIDAHRFVKRPPRDFTSKLRRLVHQGSRFAHKLRR